MALWPVLTVNGNRIFSPNPFLSPIMGLSIRMTRAVGLPPRPPPASPPPHRPPPPPWAAAGRCYSPPPRGLKPGIHWPQVASTEEICSLTKTWHPPFSPSSWIPTVTHFKQESLTGGCGWNQGMTYEVIGAWHRSATSHLRSAMELKAAQSPEHKTLAFSSRKQCQPWYSILWFDILRRIIQETLLWSFELEPFSQYKSHRKGVNTVLDNNFKVERTSEGCDNHQFLGSCVQVWWKEQELATVERKRKSNLRVEKREAAASTCAAHPNWDEVEDLLVVQLKPGKKEKKERVIIPRKKRCEKKRSYLQGASSASQIKRRKRSELQWDAHTQGADKKENIPIKDALWVMTQL